MKYFTAIMAMFLICLMSMPSYGQSSTTLAPMQALTCPASDSDTTPPDFSSPDCKSISVNRIDPQGRHIWVKVVMYPDISKVSDQTQLSLFLSARASSVIYLNGQKLMENGVPSDEKSREVAGKMDVDIPIPQGLMGSEDKQIIMRMSSHQGYMKMNGTIQLIAIGRSRNIQNSKLRYYWPTLLPFGALILGGLYFIVMAVRGQQPRHAALLSTMSFAAATQLFIEISRGLFAFTYPVQDLRLIGIWICAAIFGMSLAAFIIYRFQFLRKFLLIAISMGLIVLSLAAYGMDTKASLAFLLPTIFAAGLCFYKGIKGFKDAWVFAAALIIFAGINGLTSWKFLDVYFYYVVLALLLFLFAQQAAAFAREQGLHIIEAKRSERLQMALDKKDAEKIGVTINISNAGRIHVINTLEMVHIDAAGDYTNIVLETGKAYLHRQTLAELEIELPPHFLRVHRSHIVNTDCVEGLSRNPSGTGSLSLSNGDTVPVSRRIMPSVRKALN